MTRRTFLVALAATGWAACPIRSIAQSGFLANPVKVLVGFPPGTATDVATRAVTAAMGTALGASFVVENRAGAGSNIAARALVAAPADGYTLFASTVANTINALIPGSGFVDPLKDFAPITLIGDVPNVLVLNPSLPASSLEELIKLAKAQPGVINYGSSGIGTSPHLSAEMFASQTGIKLTHVPYRGSTPAVNDLLGGQVQMMFAPASSVMPFVRAGKLRALAVASARRTAIAPDLPTMAEEGLKGFETSVWIGLVAPIGTPAAVIDKLRAAAHAAIDTADVQGAFHASGVDPLKTTSQEFTRYMQSESARWAKVIQSAGIKFN